MREFETRSKPKQNQNSRKYYVTFDLFNEQKKNTHREIAEKRSKRKKCIFYDLLVEQMLHPFDNDEIFDFIAGTRHDTIGKTMLYFPHCCEQFVFFSIVKLTSELLIVKVTNCRNSFTVAN